MKTEMNPIETLDDLNANAALIAAAPKMLEALKKIVTNAIECPMDSGPSLVDGVTWDMINDAKKTVRLAEGKP